MDKRAVVDAMKVYLNGLDHGMPPMVISPWGEVCPPDDVRMQAWLLLHGDKDYNYYKLPRKVCVHANTLLQKLFGVWTGPLTP